MQHSNLLVRAELALGQGHFEEALGLALRRIEIEPDSEQAQLIAADAEIGLQQYETALQRLEPIQPADENLQMRRDQAVGSCLMNLGRLDDAEDHFESILADQANQTQAAQTLLLLYQYQGRNWEAQQLAERLLEDGVTSPEIRRASQGADLVLTASELSIHASQGELRDGRAEMLHQARKLFTVQAYDYAEDYLRKILADEPTLAEAQGRLGQILALTRPHEFPTWHQALPGSISEHPEIWFARGIAAESCGELPLATRFYLQVLSLHKKHGQASVRFKKVVEQIGFDSRELSALKLADAKPADPAIAIARMTIDEQQPFDWQKVFARLTRDVGDRSETTSLSFVDVSEPSQINFQYDNGSAPGNLLGHIIESTGGGVAAIDFDLDGWPDLYCTQSGNWRGSVSPQTIDQLFRNLGDGQFSNVTDECGINETGDSHGASVGDCNSDGFPDLYICNLFGNRLYVNNGDGTWTDATEESETAGDEWSLSAAFADLNADGLTDLYVVNYLDRNQVLETPCLHDGRPRSCPPTFFSGTDDRCYLNLGDGHFRDIGQLADFRAPGAKGMGLIAGNLDDSGKMSLFVTNDTTGNFLFRCQTDAISTIPRFADVGIAQGVAFDETGQAQASMGIAGGDTDGDGRLDLFTTSFYGEANTLYRQTDAGFQDQSRVANLREDSFYQLGFGTQFLDADLDGDLDLFIANGHIDSTFATGEPDRMSPQLYENQGDGRFQLLCSTGTFFEEKMLGRAVALIDWNRDGRRDLAVTHLDRPLALLENRSATNGHWIALRLVGTRHDRDAIGATVRVTANGKTQTHFLLAGSGFACSNERKLTIGLGQATKAEKIEVSWLNGSVELFESIPPDRELICIQGRGRLLPGEVRRPEH